MFQSILKAIVILGFSATGFFTIGQPEISHAQITTTLDVTPTYNGDDPWNVGFLGVGESAHGTLNIAGGSEVNNTDGGIGAFLFSNGNAVVTGTNSRWNSSGYLDAGSDGDGTLTIEAGGRVSSNEAAIGYGGTSNGNGHHHGGWFSMD